MKDAKQHQVVTPPVSAYTGIILLGLLSLDIPVVSGQTPIQVGDKVRVTAPRVGLQRSVGVVRETGDGAVAIDFGQPGGALRVRTDDIRKVDVTFTHGSHARLGAVIGLLAGAGIGAAVGHARGNSYSCAGDPDAKSQGLFPTALCLHVTREFKAGVGAVVGGLLGGSLGALIGRSLKTDRWLPAFARDSQVSVGPPFRPGQPSFAIRVAF